MTHHVQMISNSVIQVERELLKFPCTQQVWRGVISSPWGFTSSISHIKDFRVSKWGMEIGLPKVHTSHLIYSTTLPKFLLSSTSVTYRDFPLALF